MSITVDQLKAIANTLADVAAVYDPKDAALLKLLINAGSALNTLIHDIHAQTPTEMVAVWNEVREDYNASLAAFEATVK